nr:hypothetical protein [Cupriavidus sp. IDO]
MIAPAAFGQGAPATDESAEALRNIQSNFARMTPPPRSVDSINQELRQGEVKSQSASAGRHGGRGRGRQQQAGNPSADSAKGAVDPGQAAPAVATPSTDQTGPAAP